jgi:hypothetical protein
VEFGYHLQIEGNQNKGQMPIDELKIFGRQWRPETGNFVPFYRPFIASQK